MHFRYHLPLEWKCSFEQTWISLTQRFFVPSLVEIWAKCSGVKILSIYFVIISPWKSMGPFLWTKLNSLHPRMLCAKFGSNWPSGSGEKDFLKFYQYIFTLLLVSPLGKRTWSFIWIIKIPITQGCLYQVPLKLAMWLWRRRKMWKVYDNDICIDVYNGQFVIKKSSLEPSAQVS